MGNYHRITRRKRLSSQERILSAQTFHSYGTYVQPFGIPNIFWVPWALGYTWSAPYGTHQQNQGYGQGHYGQGVAYLGWLGALSPFSESAWLWFFVYGCIYCFSTSLVTGVGVFYILRKRLCSFWSFEASLCFMVCLRDLISSCFFFFFFFFFFGSHTISKFLLPKPGPTTSTIQLLHSHGQRRICSIHFPGRHRAIIRTQMGFIRRRSDYFEGHRRATEERHHTDTAEKTAVSDRVFAKFRDSYRISRWGVLWYMRKPNINEVAAAKEGVVGISLALETITAVKFGAVDRAKEAQANHLSPWRDFPWVGLNVKLPITQLFNYGPLSKEAVQKTVDSGRRKMANYYITNKDKMKKNEKDNMRARVEAKIYHYEPCDKSFSSFQRPTLHNISAKHLVRTRQPYDPVERAFALPFPCHDCQVGFESSDIKLLFSKKVRNSLHQRIPNLSC